MAEKNYSSDSPVYTKEEDRFSRWAFAERIAQVIARRSDPSSIIIGLYGVWGDGKTSVLNFIETALTDNNNVICIRFNPWRFGTEDELLKGFFLKIADALDTNLIKSGDKLKDFLKKTLPVANTIGLKGIGDSISSFISSPDINEFRSRIEKELESQKKRVLIIVDDIDRLEKSEIQAVFRLVKLTADFKYTAYILAFDKDIVAASLQDRYSSTINNAGEAFLEKIIHVPLHLPVMEKRLLQNFCFQGIDEALSIAEIELSQEQIQEFVRYFTLAFDECLSTPRKAKLYSNIILFSLPILKDEVNPVDLMLIEGLRVFCFPLYEVIRKNKILFTGTFDNYQYAPGISIDDSKKEKVKNLIEDTIDSNQLSNKQGYIKLLTNLFPKLQSLYGNTYFGSESYDRWDAGQMICSENYFSRYFTYSIPQDDISDNSVTQIISDLQASVNSIQKDRNPLADLITSSNSETLIRKLIYKASLLNEKESIPLALAISMQSDSYPNPISFSFYTTPFVQAAMLVSDLIQNLTEEKRVQLACDCIEKASDISFKQEIFDWLRRNNEEKAEKDGFSEDQIQQIGEHLGKNISEYLKPDFDITLNFSRNTPKILYLIKQYLGQPTVNEYFDSIFNTDRNVILRLLDAYTSHRWSLGSGSSGLPSKSDLERRQYDAIVEVFGTDKIIDAITIFNEGELPKISDEFPRRYDSEDRLILIKQFIWIHNYVSIESQSSTEE